MVKEIWQEIAFRWFAGAVILFAVVGTLYPGFADFSEWLIDILPSVAKYLLIGAACSSIAYSVVRDHKLIIFGIGMPSVAILAFIIKVIFF